MLDILLFRTDKGGNPDIVRQSQRARYSNVDIVDTVIELDSKYRAAQYNTEQRRAELGRLQKEIGQKKKAKEDAADLIEQKNKIDEEILVLEKQSDSVLSERDRVINLIGNIVHESVRVSNNEDDNPVVKKWGEFATRPGLLHHYELLTRIDGYDPERGVKVSGHRGYFLKGAGFLLNQALINYGISFLAKRGYIPLQTPFLMKKEVMAQTAQLEDFDEQLYKVLELSRGKKLDDGTPAPLQQDDEKYLIATSEQPISAYHMDEVLEEGDLPIRYAGFSSCFRKEAGSMRDARGIFRVHQFEKVEQFCITTPEKSWEMHEEMLKAAEEFYQSLNIPYRVVIIVSAALNNAAAKKYDLEGWFPAFNGCRELVSCSNCTDYQSRNLNVRFRERKDPKEKDKKTAYVHMLNCTLTATTRTVCAILENNQTETGINVPEVLQPFMGGTTFIPFTVELKEEKEGAKKDQKKK